MKLRKLAAAAAISLGIAGSAHAVPVALELSLVIDVSGSINTTEYNTQRNGYAAAFNDAGVQNAILSFVPSGGVAVNVIQFAENAVQSIGWTLLDSMGDISAFATAIGNMARVGSIGSGTDIQDGMSLGISSFNNNGYEGNRLVIDVSGDGIQNIDPACNLAAPYTGNCAAVQTARNAAASAGIRVNGLAMEGDFGVAGVTNFYANNVITADGFVITASGIDDFERAVVSKIGREITNVPEPGSIALLGLALSGLAFVRRRRQA